MAVLTQQNQPHFVLFPFMAQGHMIPMVDIARLLAQRGVRITIFLTPHNATRVEPVISRAQQSGLPIQVLELVFPCADAGLPEGCENFDMLSSFDQAQSFFVATKMLQPRVEELVSQMEPIPSCIIADMCFPWTTNLARKLNIPRVVFHGMCCFSLMCVHNLVDWSGFERVESDSEYFQVPGLPDKIELTKSQLTNLVNPSSNQGKEFNKELTEAEENAFGVVVNTFEELEPEYVELFKKEKRKHVWTIGPVSLHNNVESDKAERGNKASIDKHDCLKWLESKRTGSVLYVCLGSLSRLPTPQMIELWLGLESSNCPFIWVIRHVSEAFQHWLLQEKYEERVKDQGLIIYGWAPQILILSHPSVGGFLTHCGWNSTLEGIASGLPLITWPLFAEQFSNERLVVNVLKTGVRSGVESQVMFGMEEETGVQVKRDEVSLAIEKVFGEGEEGEMIRKRAKALGEMAKRAVDDEDGSSHLNIAKLIQDVVEESNTMKPV